MRFGVLAFALSAAALPVDKRDPQRYGGSITGELAHLTGDVIGGVASIPGSIIGGLTGGLVGGVVNGVGDVVYGLLGGGRRGWKLKEKRDPQGLLGGLVGGLGNLVDGLLGGRPQYGPDIVVVPQPYQPYQPEVVVVESQPYEPYRPDVVVVDGGRDWKEKRQMIDEVDDDSLAEVESDEVLEE